MKKKELEEIKNKLEQYMEIETIDCIQKEEGNTIKLKTTDNYLLGFYVDNKDNIDDRIQSVVKHYIASKEYKRKANEKKQVR